MADAELALREQCHDAETGLVAESFEESGYGSHLEAGRAHHNIRISAYPRIEQPFPKPFPDVAPPQGAALRADLADATLVPAGYRSARVGMQGGIDVE